MHVRTQLRNAVKDRLIAAGVAGGNVHTHDPRVIGQEAYPLVLIEPEIETGIEVKGPYAFRPRQQDGKVVGRLQTRPTRFSVTVYALDEGTCDEVGNLLTITKDADEAADDLCEATEAALFGAVRLTVKDSNGAERRLGERDLKLVGSGSVRNPETGMRVIGAAHMLFEALLLTDEGDPSNTITR